MLVEPRWTRRLRTNKRGSNDRIFEISMANKFLRTVGTGFGVAALVAAATAIHAQDTNTVGNPQLKDFNLPGTRTTPPVTTQPAPVTPPVIEPLPPVPTPTDTPAASRPAPAPSEPRATRQAPETRQQPARREPAPATSAPPPTQAPAPTPEATLPTPAPVGTEQALPAPTAVPESQAAPAPAPAEAPAATASEPQRGLPWLPIGIAALLALIGLTALLLFKRSRAASTVNAADVETPQAPLPGEPDPLLAAMAAKRKSAATPAAAPTTKPVSTRPPAPTPAPAPAAAPAASPALAAGTEPRGDIVGVSMRPRLEIEFKPDRAAATLTETSVQFELTIRNVGNRTARDVRIQIHMDNPGPNRTGSWTPSSPRRHRRTSLQPSPRSRPGPRHRYGRASPCPRRVFAS
jgi:hypothetical protein